MRYIKTALAGWLLLCSLGLVLAQETRRSPSPTPEDAGASIVEAIRNRDIATLIGFVSEAGVNVGTDGPTIPAAVFRRLLRQKRGVYCDILDSFCQNNAGKRMEDGSLRGLLLRQSVKLDSHSLRDTSAQAVVVDIRKDVYPNEILFSLVLVKEKGTWKLVNIDYE